MSDTKSYVDSIAINSNSITLSNVGTLISGYHSAFGPGLTDDELKELDSLEKEYK